MKLKKFTNVEFEGIDWNDYPDFCDAFIVHAEYEGKELTEEEIESIDSDVVYKLLWEYLF